MASDTDTTTPAFGRRLLAGATAVTGLALATLPGAAAPIPPAPDAALVDLAHRWRAAWSEAERICDALEDAEAARDVARIAACDREQGAIFDTIADIESAITDTPAQGAEGLAVKAALLARVFLGPNEPGPADLRLARSLAADSLRIAPYAAEIEA